MTRLEKILKIKEIESIESASIETMDILKDAKKLTLEEATNLYDLVTRLKMQGVEMGNSEEILYQLVAKDPIVAGAMFAYTSEKMRDVTSVLMESAKIAEDMNDAGMDSEGDDVEVPNVDDVKTDDIPNASLPDVDLVLLGKEVGVDIVNRYKFNVILRGAPFALKELNTSVLNMIAAAKGNYDNIGMIVDSVIILLEGDKEDIKDIQSPWFTYLLLMESATGNDAVIAAERLSSYASKSQSDEAKKAETAESKKPESRESSTSSDSDLTAAEVVTGIGLGAVAAFGIYTLGSMLFGDGDDTIVIDDSII